jgi:uncharacterized protein (UPF0332 family)
MDPADFISLAIRLSKSNSEADLRTAVSRAYYGAFHTVRRFLEECRLYLSSRELHGAEIHRKVRFCLVASGNVDAIDAAGKLGSLRNLRNEADYDFSLAKFKKSARVVPMVLISQDIVDALQRCRTDPAYSEIREKIRAYARDVLRLTIDGS